MSKHPSSFRERLLLSDLDSTLIYSHRRSPEPNCVWVEELNGRPQSFMTAKAFRYFRDQCWLHVVPLTTRNHAQFARLQEACESLHMHRALICNGAVLLSGRCEDADWRAESEALCAPLLNDLEGLRQYAEQLAGAEQVIYTEPFFFYVRASDPAQIMQALQNAADPERFFVARDARKVYCIPTVLSKGHAAARFCKRFGVSGYLAAGDSSFDIPLLLSADTAFCPETLEIPADAACRLHRCGGRFSDTLCDQLEKLRNEETDLD